MTPLPQQLDIFAHSHDIMLRNDVLAALEQRDPAGACRGWQALADAFPQDPALAQLDTLTQALERHSDTALADHNALARERLALRRACDRCSPAGPWQGGQ